MMADIVLPATMFMEHDDIYQGGGQPAHHVGPQADRPAGRCRAPTISSSRNWPSASDPFRLATSPARNFLNSTFAETPVSREKEGRPELLIHSEDAAALGLATGDRVEIGNTRGEVVLHVSAVRQDQARRGHRRGHLAELGSRARRRHQRLTGADAPAPYGGAAVHDNKVWIRPAA
jgi:anaerobic selenocysteine-containing dehydrogenase